MAKCQKRSLVLLVFGLLVIIAAGVWMVFGRKTQIYEKTEEIFGNPLMGYAPCAWEETIGEDISLLYMDITWAELEPEEGKYDWEKIERENQTDRWREEGKHLVLRFVCDIPGEEKHMDIPQWLYDKTDHAGTWYDMEYGKGYAPDYNNEQMIQYHKRAVNALGEHFGRDGLVSYIVVETCSIMFSLTKRSSHQYHGIREGLCPWNHITFSYRFFWQTLYSCRNIYMPFSPVPQRNGFAGSMKAVSLTRHMRKKGYPQ